HNTTCLSFLFRSFISLAVLYLCQSSGIIIARVAKYHDWRSTKTYRAFLPLPRGSKNMLELPLRLLEIQRCSALPRSTYTAVLAALPIEKRAQHQALA